MQMADRVAVEGGQVGLAGGPNWRNCSPEGIVLYLQEQSSN